MTTQFSSTLFMFEITNLSGFRIKMKKKKIESCRDLTGAFLSAPQHSISQNYFLRRIIKQRVIYHIATIIFGPKTSLRLNINCQKIFIWFILIDESEKKKKEEFHNFNIYCLIYGNLMFYIPIYTHMCVRVCVCCTCNLEITFDAVGWLRVIFFFFLSGHFLIMLQWCYCVFAWIKCWISLDWNEIFILGFVTCQIGSLTGLVLEF